VHNGDISFNLLASRVAGLEIVHLRLLREIIRSGKARLGYGSLLLQDESSQEGGCAIHEGRTGRF
jgi:hypothetical protein